MKVINVVAAIIEHENKFLIAKKARGEFAGFWEFPGGKIEENESDADALKREIKEEFEIEISIRKFFTTVEHNYDNFHLCMNCYLCSINNLNFNLHDHSDFKWLSVKELKTQKNWIPADIQIINKLIKESA